jgi:hypothetical protein
MRIHGYCTGCRKIKLVNVSSAGMVTLARGGVPMGICAQCEEENRK